MSEWRPADYWESLEDAQEPLMALLEEEAGDPWTVRGAAITGQADGGDTLFVLVLRHRIGDAGLLVRLGYAVVDLSEPTDPVAWTDNFVDIRMQGSVLQALDVLLGGESLGDPEEPPALDARPGSLEEEARDLTAPVGEVFHTEQEAPAEDQPPTGMVRCTECGELVSEEQAEDLSAGGSDLGSIWVHQGGCPDE